MVIGGSCMNTQEITVYNRVEVDGTDKYVPTHLMGVSYFNGNIFHSVMPVGVTNSDVSIIIPNTVISSNNSICIQPSEYNKIVKDELTSKKYYHLGTDAYIYLGKMNDAIYVEHMDNIDGLLEVSEIYDYGFVLRKEKDTWVTSTPDGMGLPHIEILAK